MGWRLRKLFRRPMKVADVYEIIDDLLNNYGWMHPSWKETLLTKENPVGGGTYDEWWRKNLNEVIQSIIDEPTWRLKKRKILRTHIIGSTWIVAYNVISDGYQNDVDLWADSVEKIDKFSENEKSSWFWMLARENILNCLTLSVFAPVEKTLFDISDEDKEKIKSWRDMKKYSLRKRLSFKKKHREIMEETPEIGYQFNRLFQERCFPYWEKENVFFQKFAEE